MYIFLCILAIIIIYLIVLYNVALSKKNKMLKAYSSLDVMLKKRYDLIPNIVNTVKGYKEYEAETLANIIALRKKADEDKSTSDLNDTASKYASFIKDINILREQYPDLKASSNFMHLQKTLNEIEEQISAARRTYNAHVESFNTFIAFIPNNIFAPVFGFKPCDFFEATDDEREKVEVNI